MTYDASPTINYQLSINNYQLTNGASPTINYQLSIIN
jgi:hypothetical protein